MDGSSSEISVQTKWLKLGAAVAFLHYLFIFLVVSLFEVDPALAVIVAIVTSVVGGITFTLFVLYVY